MTIGISKERLEELSSKASREEDKDFLDTLFFQCTELNPWLPIETAPKDRRVLLFHPVIVKPYIGQWLDLNGKTGYWDYVGLIYISEQPTHYQELPGDPD